MSDCDTYFAKLFLTIFSGIFLVMCISCQSATQKKGSVQQSMIAQLDTNQHTTIQWKDTLIQFGKVAEGDTVRLQYDFTNTGNKKLFINDVRPSCGCTIADFTEKPILPGETGYVKALFATRWHPGQQQKSILVKTNTKGTVNHKLIFSGEVIPAPATTR